MSFKKLVYDGNTQQWFSEIMNSKDHLLLCGLEEKDEVFPEDPPDERLIGLYTSATTGKSKCIWNSLDKLMLNARISAREFDILENDRLLMMAKPWHVAGLSWVLMAENMKLNYTFIPTKKGETYRWYESIQDVKPDYLLTVPAVLRSLFEFDNWFVPNIVFGGSPITYEDYRSLSDHTQTMYQGYGQTEAGGLISCHKIESPDSIGPQMPYCYGIPPKEFELKCKGSSDHPKPIFLRSPSSIHEDFYDTGDLGYLDKSGLLNLVGRSS